MPKWWSEFARAAGIKVNRNTTLKTEESEHAGKLTEITSSSSLTRFSGLIAQPYISSAIPISVTSTLRASRAEQIPSHTTNHTFTSLPMQLSSEYVFASEIHTIESQDRLWDLEEILQMRIVKGGGLRAKRTKQYLIQWTPS